jgi:hypothetical protein
MTMKAKRIVAALIIAICFVMSAGVSCKILGISDAAQLRAMFPCVFFVWAAFCLASGWIWMLLGM